MIALSDITKECMKLDREISRLSDMVTLDKTVISVSNPQFMLLYVPLGCEAAARAELNR